MSVDANNKPKDLIAETYIALNSSTTSISRLEMATSDWITGLPPFEFDGENFAVVVCIDDLGEPTGPSTYPQIARDNDGNTHNDRNWIYDVDGNYVRSINYLVMGDWLMRVNVETAAAPSGDADTDTDADSDVDADNDTDSDVDVLALGQITPSTMVVGEAVDVVLLGSGFTADVEVNIGGLSLTGLDVLNSETIDGRVPSAIPAGIHDVEVQIPGGDSVVLEGAFEVTDGSVGETASCGCTSNSAAAGWLALGLAGLIVRRRR
jgi:MYXO-CTERM domain-containing protein